MDPIHRRTRALMLGAFGLIAALLLAIQVFGYVESTQTRRSIEVIQQDALASVELVNRVQADVDRERILLHRHIFEHEEVEFAPIERQIDAVRADYARVARAYTPLVAFPGELAAWNRLANDVEQVHRALGPTLQLSRRNRDGEATRALIALDPLFERVENDVAKLVEINRTGGLNTVTAVAVLAKHQLHVRLLLGGLVLLTIVLAGMRATQTIERILGQLVESRAELQNRNRELDAFAGRVAHDLRGPLGTLGLSTTLIAERAPEVADTTAIMERGVAQMADLVEDLLQLSRIGALPGAIAATAPVATALEKELAPIFKDAGGELRIDLQPAEVTCSRGLLRQILWNLGDNAVKYRRRDVPPVFQIVGRTRGGRYRLRASDNGLGMSDDDVGHVFEPFFRSQQTRRIPGTGLGLAIVRRVVEASGGSISISSQLGIGTTFEIDLPLAPPRAGRDA